MGEWGDGWVSEWASQREYEVSTLLFVWFVIECIVFRVILESRVEPESEMGSSTWAFVIPEMWRDSHDGSCEYYYPALSLPPIKPGFKEKIPQALSHIQSLTRFLYPRPVLPISPFPHRPHVQVTVAPPSHSCPPSSQCSKVPTRALPKRNAKRAWHRKILHRVGVYKNK